MSEQNVEEGTAEEKVEMRRIAEKGEVPTDKEELIKYLTQRIQQAEQALDDTELLLDREKTKRERIASTLADRSVQLNKLLELDKKSLPEKIKDRLEEILTEAITSKLAVENNLQQAQKQNYEYRQALTELKELEAQESMEQQILTEKEGRAKNEVKILENSIKIAEESIKELQASIAAKKQKKEEVENKYLQMRVAVDRMGDIRSAMNRFFTNEQLFNDRMELKEQAVKRPVVKQPVEQSKLPPTKDIHMQKQPKLKPIEKKAEKNLTTSNNEEDFWNGEVQDRKPNPKQKLPSFRK